ncbi:MAG: class I SAM-dependent methyltransferase [Candidatus Nealsonbacteria bacterium]|nr:class I SAM-dependent methyltransferase [Candidatus Nealsonbacteria bacterium]
MEYRKQKEIEHYDEKAEELMKKGYLVGTEGDFEGFKPNDLSSFSFCYKLLEENCKGKKVLDYGCGNGVHTVFLARTGAEKVIAIDLSEKSLKIAREKAKREGMEGKIEFLAMDCEKLEFAGNSFDVVFDGGSFSSLDIEKVYTEIARVLKSGGILIGIETFGHNPVANLKRKLNKATGKRTEWAEGHIFNLNSLKLAKKYFGEIKAWHFHIVSFLAIPFLEIPGGKIILKILEVIDRALLSIPFLRKYGFKAVFIMKKTIKYV